MPALAAPQYDLIARWKATGQAPNYCAMGWYHGFIGDNSTTSSSVAWVNALKSHSGQDVEIIMLAMSLSLGNPNVVNSVVGLPQHFYLQVPLCPNDGHYLPNTVNGTNDHYFTAIVTSMIAAGVDMTHFTCVLGWEFFLGNIGTFQWSLSSTNTTSAYISAFQRAVTTMRTAGFTGTFMCDMTGGSPTQITSGTIWPGNSYCDMVGYHAYNGMVSSSTRTNVPLWWTSDKVLRLNACTSFARANSKLCGMSEMGLIQPAPGDTSSSTYLFHTIDTALYWPYIHDYCQANSDVWAGITVFNQDLGNPTSEFTQVYYFGTDPATQSSSHYADTSVSGPCYDTVATEHSLSPASHVRAVMVPGSMQLVPVTPPPPPTGVGTTVLRAVQPSYQTF